MHNLRWWVPLRIQGEGGDGTSNFFVQISTNKSRNKYRNIEKANICMIPIGFCMIPLFCLKVLVTAQGCILEKVDIWIFGKWKWFWKNCSWISLFRAKWCLRCWMIQETVWSVKEYPISFDLEHISSKYMRISFTENAKNSLSSK